MNSSKRFWQKPTRQKDNEFQIIKNWSMQNLGKLNFNQLLEISRRASALGTDESFEIARMLTAEAQPAISNMSELFLILSSITVKSTRFYDGAPNSFTEQALELSENLTQFTNYLDYVQSTRGVEILSWNNGDSFYNRTAAKAFYQNATAEELAQFMRRIRPGPQNELLIAEKALNQPLSMETFGDIIYQMTINILRSNPSYHQKLETIIKAGVENIKNPTIAEFMNLAIHQTRIQFPPSLVKLMVVPLIDRFEDPDFFPVLQKKWPELRSLPIRYKIFKRTTAPKILEKTQEILGQSCRNLLSNKRF